MVVAGSSPTRPAPAVDFARHTVLAVAMGQRSLLIPIIAFDTAYRWGAEGEEAPDRQGRTARAFIVGQDQEPPALFQHAAHLAQSRADVRDRA